MFLRYYKIVYNTGSGPRRPFAKQAFSMGAEEIVKACEQFPEYLRAHQNIEAIGGSTFYFIDVDLIDKEDDSFPWEYTFTSDNKFCIMRHKFIPEGGVRERYALIVMQMTRERELSEKEESFINKLKEFRERDGATKLCICASDIVCMQCAAAWWEYEYGEMPNFGAIDFGPLKAFMDEEIVNYACDYRFKPDEFGKAVRSALFQSETVDEAIELANSVFVNCGCGRRLSDEELLSLGINLESYHKNWPRTYIGEINGNYFVNVEEDHMSSGVSKDLDGLRGLIQDAEYRSYASALYRNGGRYRCGGRPI